MKITAILSDSFLAGKTSTKFATDWVHLSSPEKAVIAQFMVDVGEGKSLVGKNKPSWVDDNHEKIPGTDGYEQESYWHYHCGPGWNTYTFKGYTVDLAFNPNGKASQECIHYFKKSISEIVIVGYSRVHIPFLVSDWGPNPFFD